MYNRRRTHCNVRRIVLANTKLSQLGDCLIPAQDLSQVLWSTIQIHCYQDLPTFKIRTVIYIYNILSIMLFCSTSLLYYFISPHYCDTWRYCIDGSLYLFVSQLLLLRLGCSKKFPSLLHVNILLNKEPTQLYISFQSLHISFTYSKVPIRSEIETP